MARYLVISADCHAGLPAPLYRPYLEQKYRATSIAISRRPHPGAARA